MAPVCSVEGSGGGGDVVIVRPDIKQMLPFQPSSISGVSKAVYVPLLNADSSPFLVLVSL